MKYMALCAALILAGCNSESDRQPSSDPGEKALAPVPVVSGSPAQADNAAALLNGLAEPRQKGRYAPRDDCGGQAGASEFRRKLAEAVARDDAQAIAALASPDIKLGFAGDDGRERFIEQLKQPNGEMLAELKRLLPLGCSVNPQGNLTIPWFFAADMGEVDSYSGMMVTGEDVPLRAAPDSASAVKQRISWDVVELVDGLDADANFQQVRARDGTEGYILTAELRSLLASRLLASREKGEWKITAIVAGD